MARKRKRTADAVEIIHRRFFQGKPQTLDLLERERMNAEIARQIYDLRTEADLTQRWLARLAGTSTSAICRLEDGDYRGHSLGIFQRIAAALNRRVDVRFVLLKGERKAA